MRVLEIGTYVVPAFAGMVLAEQGHEVTKWTSPGGPDPIEGLEHGPELWKWINEGKALACRHATAVAEIQRGRFHIVLDNIRAATWKHWGIDPAEEAERLGVVWVSMRDDFDGRSFDAVAQARAWGDHIGYVPAYLGDTAGGLWLAFKALASSPGHHVVHQAAALAKLVEGELVVEAERYGKRTPWDEPGTYGENEAGTGVEVHYRGEVVSERFRDDEWRRRNLRHVEGRYVI
ncbi:CoA transferase [Streptomyces sp. NPDC093261]|uniref:CoA transferase n=1 Tax=Streptomyces sp. NPDC093261 TaxID=3366037 RepID=UPI0038098C96